MEVLMNRVRFLQKITFSTIALLLICTAAFAQQKGTGTLTDNRDKKKYKTVNIGGLTWMAENLDYNAKGSEKCPNLNLNMDDSKSIRCWKNNAFAECVNVKCIKFEEDSDFQNFCAEYRNLTAKEIQDRDKRVEAKCAKEGRQYSNLPDNNVCPAGWHLPNDKEWSILRDAIRNSTDEYGFGAVSSFRVVSEGVVRCVQGKSSEEVMAEVEKKVAAEKEAAEKAEVEKAIGKQFNPKIKYGSMTDARDKKTYKTTKIGGQTWMAENLNYDAKGSRCYKDKDYYCKKDGRLYDWATAKTVCPAGWHLPTDGEWTILENAVGGGSVARTKLIATNGWFESYSKKPINGTDDFGFSAVPTGSGGWMGKSFKDGNEGTWWSASEGRIGAIPRNITALSGEQYEKLGINSGEKTLLFSVRCVQGEAPKEEPASAPAKAPAAPANNPSKPMYCVIYMGGKLTACTELRDTQEGKANCDMQNSGLKMMGGQAKWTDAKPNVKCNK
jgi:uncharacterized protein (TIGR02145 family)